MPQLALATAFIALGSNLGDRLALLRLARARLADHPQTASCRCSPLYETDAVGGPPGQGAYLNAVLQLSTALAPQALLAYCLAIEAELGRVRAARWDARTIDLDLLLYDDLVLTQPELTLPHPRLHQRRFVLVPLLDLTPDLCHPLLRRRMTELAADCPDSGAVERLQTTW